MSDNKCRVSKNLNRFFYFPENFWRFFNCQWVFTRTAKSDTCIHSKDKVSRNSARSTSTLSVHKRFVGKVL